MQTSRSYNTASSSSLRYLHGPPPLPLPLPTPSASSSTTHNVPVREGSSKSVHPVVSALPSSPSFVRSQAESFERRIKQHTKASERKKPSYVPPVPPLPSSSKDTRSPCSPKTLNVTSYPEQAAVLTSSLTPAKASLGSALPIRKSTVRKKPAPPVSPSLHAELHKTRKAKKISDPSAPRRPVPVRGINSSTLSLGLGITFNDENNERAYALGQDAVQQGELTTTVSPVPDTQETPSSPGCVVRVDDVDRDSPAPDTAVPAREQGKIAESHNDSGRFPSPLPSTTSDSYDLALLEVDRAFHARIELTLRAPGVVAEGGPVERPIRRGASSITLGRARSLRQTSIRAAEPSVRSASASATVRSTPNVSKWLASIDTAADPRSEGVASAVELELGGTPPIVSPSSISSVRQQHTPRAEFASRSDEEKATPAITRAPSIPNISLFRNKSISTLRRTLSRSRSSQKQPDGQLGTEKCRPLTPERRVADAFRLTAQGVHTPKRAQTDTLKRSRPQQKQSQWWEHAIVVVGAASPGAFY